MLIEVDHLSEIGPRPVLKIAAHHHYPLVSSHTGHWRRLDAGGAAQALPDRRLCVGHPSQAPDLAKKIDSFRAYRDGTSSASASAPTPAASRRCPARPTAAERVTYPFEGYRSGVEFDRQRTGSRTFDFNADGVAHYGLFPDLLAATEKAPGGERAMRTLFRSAEAYLRMWQRAWRH